MDRFCGGQLNSESDEDFSIPIYCEVTSNVIWMQVNFEFNKIVPRVQVVEN